MWLKKGPHIGYAVFGAAILIMYGVVATWQTESFDRVYTTYGGIFILMSLQWAYFAAGFKPDKYDIIEVLVALVGVCIIYYAPRN